MTTQFLTRDMGNLSTDCPHNTDHTVAHTAPMSVGIKLILPQGFYFTHSTCSSLLVVVFGRKKKKKKNPLLPSCGFLSPPQVFVSWNAIVFWEVTQAGSVSCAVGLGGFCLYETIKR